MESNSFTYVTRKGRVTRKRQYNFNKTFEKRHLKRQKTIKNSSSRTDDMADGQQQLQAQQQQFMNDQQQQIEQLRNQLAVQQQELERYRQLQLQREVQQPQQPQQPRDYAAEMCALLGTCILVKSKLKFPNLRTKTLAIRWNF